MSDIVQATVDELGYISLYLRDDMIVLIAPNQVNIWLLTNSLLAKYG